MSKTIRWVAIANAAHQILLGELLLSVLLAQLLHDSLGVVAKLSVDQNVVRGGHVVDGVMIQLAVNHGFVQKRRRVLRNFNPKWRLKISFNFELRKKKSPKIFENSNFVFLFGLTRSA